MAYAAITKPGSYMNTKLYTGNATDDTAITGVGFQPDLTWIKTRGSVKHHALFDAVRTATKYIQSNTTAIEGTDATSLKSFDSDGFTLGVGSTLAVVNQDTIEMASWNWKAGTTSGLSGGTITPSGYSFNTTSGFSIITYTGTGSAGTIPHGLGVVPQAVICKKLDGVDGWFSYHEPLGNTGRLMLDNTNAAAYDAGYWDETTPTSSVFSVRGNGGNNATGDAYVAYCFADVKGYSKFSSYVGNANADGTFVYTGFKPSCLIIKRTTVDNWMIMDNKRLGYNVDNEALRPNLSDAETTTDYLDILSNGFKMRTTAGDVNGASTYIYLAFAEEPLVANVGSSIPATAR